MVLVAALSAGAAAYPESLLGTLALSVVVVWWAVAAGGEVPVSAVPAAVLLLVAHLAAHLLSHGPRVLAPDRWLVLTWVRRGALVALAAPGVWLLAALVRDQPEPPGLWVAALVAAVAGCLVAGAAVAVGEEPA